jgi:hypothetical protein
MSCKNKGGRPAGHISYTPVEYNNKQYIVGILSSNDEPVAFVFDEDDKDKVAGRSWHVSSNNYIGSAETVDGKRKQLFLQRKKRLHLERSTHECYNKVTTKEVINARTRTVSLPV